MMSRTPHHGRTFSRRDMLALAGGAGLTLGLAACSVTTSSGGTGPSEAIPKSIKVPKPKVKLPRATTTFQWMDSGDLKALFEQPFFEAYHKAHPNITVDYQGTSWERINQVVPLGVRGGTAPQVFAVPNNLPVQVAVNEGWVRPIDDLIPNFKTWKAGFPSTAFIPGVHVFNGRTYTWPMSSSKRWAWMLMYDKQYLQKAGYDPAATPFTWDEFRAAAKKITTQGAGNYYGLMLIGTAAANVASTLAVLAGARMGLSPFDWQGPVDWKTGQYRFTDPALQGGFELLQGLKSDGSLFPGGLSLNDATSRARMPQRVAGMIFDGPWDIPAWPKADPTYDFGVALPPAQKSGHLTPGSYSEMGANMTWVFKQSKDPEIAADLYSYMGSADGQAQMMILSEGNLLSLMPAVTDKVLGSGRLTGRARTAAQMATRLMRTGPMVEVRNADAVKVRLAQKTVKPSFMDVGQGIMSGQITDIKGALKDLQDRTEASLDAAIKQAQQQGAKVSRDDWTFSNWTPGKDYTGQDYGTLK